MQVHYYCLADNKFPFWYLLIATITLLGNGAHPLPIKRLDERIDQTTTVDDTGETALVVPDKTNTPN